MFQPKLTINYYANLNLIMHDIIINIVEIKIKTLKTR